MERVVIVGGGWSALYVTKGLRRLARQGLIDVKVVGLDNFHTFHGFVSEMVVGRIQPTSIITSSRRNFAPFHFVHGAATQVDLDAKSVRVQGHGDGANIDLPYDHLVVTLGSHDALDRVPGAREHAFSLRQYAVAFRLRAHIIACLERASTEPDPAMRSRLLSFVVTGGGFAGIEMATELENWLRTVCAKDFPAIRLEDTRVVCVHAGDRILPEFGAHHAPLQDWAERYINTRTRLELMTGKTFAKATADEITLGDGTRIPTRTIISCIGTGMPPILDQFPSEWRDPKGRLQTDATGRVIGTDSVWAAGDCSAFPHPKGGICPQLAIYAIRAGRVAGDNLARVISGERTKPMRFAGLGDACSLGSRRAVAHLRGIRITGVPAWILWRLFLLAFMPSWDRRVRLLFDWIMVPLSGREIVTITPTAEVEVQRRRYSDGQWIIRAGDHGSTLYVVLAGAVKVWTDSGEAELATLVAGQYFGEVSVFEETERTASVQAMGEVEVLAIGRQTARSLNVARTLLSHERTTHHHDSRTALRHP